MTAVIDVTTPAMMGVPTPRSRIEILRVLLVLVMVRPAFAFSRSPFTRKPATPTASEYYFFASGRVDSQKPKGEAAAAD